MSALISPRVTVVWCAKVPTVNASWIGFDPHEWFAGYAEASARDRAEITFLGFEEFMADEGHDVEDLQDRLESDRVALMTHFGDVLAVTLNVPVEGWVSEVMDRVSAAYLDRISDLLLLDGIEARA